MNMAESSFKELMGDIQDFRPMTGKKYVSI